MSDYFLPHQPVSTADFSRALNQIRHKIHSYTLPQTVYGALHLEKNYCQIFLGHQEERVKKAEFDRYLKNYQKSNAVKIVALSIDGEGDLVGLGSKLWLDHDIVPVFNHEVGLALSKRAAQISNQFDKDGIADLDIADDNEVHPSFLVSTKAYQDSTDQKRWQQLLKLAERFKGQRLMFVSATPRGGGVALMRHAMIRLFRLLGVDAHWHILTENNTIFEITKTKFHNVLQAIADPKVKLSKSDKEMFEDWSRENARLLNGSIKQSDVIVIDDPQASGLIPYIKKHNPKARLIYRSHIQIVSKLLEDKETAAAKTWDYLWKNIKEADVFVSHPIAEFLPPQVDKHSAIMMPPTTDLLDGLNKPLSEEAMKYYLKMFNIMLLQSQQEPLEEGRPYIVQIARFDPSKGIPEVIESYRLLREKMAAHGVPTEKTPALVIVGHGSIDDPDGQPIYHLTRQALRLPLYREIASDIKTGRLPHVDQLLNTLLRKSSVVVQLSFKEGFEIKVTEALLKGKPVISFRAGGIPLQISDRKGGFVVEPTGDCEKVSEILYQLFSDPSYLGKQSKLAKRYARDDLSTISNSIRWLELALGEKKVSG